MKYEIDEQVYVVTKENTIIDLGYIKSYSKENKEYTVKSSTDTYVLEDEYIQSVALRLKEEV